MESFPSRHMVRYSGLPLAGPQRDRVDEIGRSHAGANLATGGGFGPFPGALQGFLILMVSFWRWAASPSGSFDEEI